MLCWLHKPSATLDRFPSRALFLAAMAGIMQASDTDNFLINNACSAIRTISSVGTTNVSWLTMGELSNIFRSLTELVAYILECPLKVDRGERCFLHTSVTRCVYSNEELEPSSDFE